MLQQRWFYVAVATFACVLQAQGADKYTDENRPYEFGFNIDGEQHRHEKKDENGLIMGEFGFITADGVYHVTVYATDENGNFKILSMKNIRVKPYPTAATTSPQKKGHSLPFPPSQNPPKTQGPTPPKTPDLPGGIPPASPVQSCSHCSIPTTTTKKPLLTDLAVVSQNQGNNQFGGQTPNAQYPQQGQAGQPTYPQSGVGIQGNNQYGGQPPNAQYPQPGQVGQQTYPQGEDGIQGNNQYGQGPNVQYPEQGQGGEQTYPQEGDGIPGNNQYGGLAPSAQYPQQGQDGQQAYPQDGDGLQTPFGSNSGNRNPKEFTDYPQGPNGLNGSDGPSKPTLITAQMQIVDKNTDINHKNPGEKDGLPDGLTKDDMVRLLYTFNYTVGFHGHFEEGYTNGVKQGYYYVTGRNGVRTRVDYVADEKGFRPKITQEVLDLLSDDVPKPETEKDEKYGLKGYEFKWLYYPTDSSRR